MVFPAEQQRLLPAHHMETVDFLHAQQAAEIWGQHVTFLPDRRLFSLHLVRAGCSAVDSSGNGMHLSYVGSF